MSFIPQGFLFDMDGVITANNHIHEQAWQVFNARYGKPAFSSADFAAKVVGKTNAEIAAWLFERTLSPEEATAFSEEKEEIYRQLHQPLFALTPGLLPFLQACQQAGLPCALVTNAPESNMNYTLEMGQLRPYFRATLHRDLVAQPKPAPDLYLLAASHLGLKPQQCVVFEDSFTGIAAGTAAGAQVIAVASTYTRQQLQPLAQAVIDDFTDLSPLSLPLA